MAGGLIREIGDISVPSAVRRTKTYQMMVDIALRFMIEQVGQVKGVYPSGNELASDFLMRRTAGHGIEVRACHPDCAPPHGPDPALQASRLRDPQRRLEPVTQVVPHQPAGRRYPVAFTHDEPANIHMAR